MRKNEVWIHLHRLAQLLEGLIELTRTSQNVTQPRVYREREGSNSCARLISAKDSR